MKTATPKTSSEVIVLASFVALKPCSVTDIHIYIYIYDNQIVHHNPSFSYLFQLLIHLIIKEVK